MTKFLETQVLDLEKKIEDNRPIRELQLNSLLSSNKLDWLVEKEPLQLATGEMIPFLGVVRQDTKTCFQTVSNVYQPIQNKEVAELAMIIAELSSSKIEVAKVFDKGASYYFTITGRTFEFSGNVGDVISEKIIISNSHDGTKALGISFGHTVLSCTNGMTRFDRKGYVSIRHTAKMKDKLKQSVKALGRVLDESSRMMDTYHKLDKISVGPEHVKQVLSLMTKVDMDTPVDDLSSRSKNIIQAAHQSVKEEISYKGQTAWGLLNGATHYSSLQAGESDKKLKSKMWGGAAARDRSVWQYLNSI